MPSKISHPCLIAQAKARAEKSNRVGGFVLLIALVVAMCLLNGCTPKAYSLTLHDAERPAPAQPAATLAEAH